VYLDGVKVATVDIYSSRTLVQRIVFAADDLDPTVQHTLVVRGLGTAGHPRVDVPRGVNYAGGAYPERELLPGREG